MVISGTGQAVRQHGTSQIGSSEAITFVPIAQGHVLIPVMLLQLKTFPAVNATQMPTKRRHTPVL